MGVLQMWIAAFLKGWYIIGEIAAGLLGGFAAVLVFVVAVAVLMVAVAFPLAWAFDRITTAMAKRWEKTGRRPAGRWADVIARGWEHER